MSCRWCEKSENKHSKDCPNFGEVKDSWSTPKVRDVNKDSITAVKLYKKVKLDRRKK